MVDYFRGACDTNVMFNPQIFAILSLMPLDFFALYDMLTVAYEFAYDQLMTVTFSVLR